MTPNKVHKQLGKCHASGDSLLKCICCNYRSICNKLTSLHALLDGFLYGIKFDIIVICETWLSSYISDGLLCSNREFEVMRHDRPSRSGSVCIFSNKNLPYVPITLPFKNKHLEIACVDIICSNFKHRYIVVYRTKKYDLDVTNELFSCLNGLCDVWYSITICSDFNLSHIN